jgi:general nucleoside transport system permease protein
MNEVILTGIIASAIAFATPYLYAAIGEMFAQRSGVVNLGVDGIMLVGAFAGFFVALNTTATLGPAGLWLGLLMAALAGLLMGLLMSVISVTLKAEQGISGIGLYIFGLGLSSLLFRVMIGTVKTVDGFKPAPIPVLSGIPVIGPALFSQSVVVYGAFLLVPLAWFVLERTTWGLKIKAVGQSPASADSLGVSVNRVRYVCVCLGGMLAGVAGASMSLATVKLFQDNLTAGLGFIAVALVYFGGWRPLGILIGALLFSTITSLQNFMQVLNVGISPDLAVMLPYIVTIVALMFPINRARQPAALNKPFERGEN